MSQKPDLSIHRARRLRKGSTDAERCLWRHLRHRGLCGFKFRRQHPIGPFIADFVCVEKKLVIELDGGGHAQNRQADEDRTAILGQHGYKVLRFWNHEVLSETEAVLMRIRSQLIEEG